MLRCLTGNQFNELNVGRIKRTSEQLRWLSPRPLQAGHISSMHCSKSDVQDHAHLGYRFRMHAKTERTHDFLDALDHSKSFWSLHPMPKTCKSFGIVITSEHGQLKSKWHIGEDAPKTIDSWIVDSSIHCRKMPKMNPISPRFYPAKPLLPAPTCLRELWFAAARRTRNTDVA